MIEIDKNIIIETEHLGSNNAIVCTRDGVVLIDAPHRPSDAIKWRRVAESNGPIRYLINTDHHIDHTMCNIFLPGEIVSHEGTREKLFNSPPTRQYIDDLLNVIDPAGKMYLDEYSQRLPTITFSKSMELRVGGLEFQLTHYRGHTLNSALVYLPQQKIAFTGDLVCEAGLPAFIDADTFEWIETIRKIEAMDIRYIMPGHGKVCTIKEARVFREQMEDLVGEVEKCLDGGLSRDDAMAKVYYEDRIHIATGESPAYPDHLMELFMTKSIGVIYDHIIQKRAESARR
jgi:cyclase